MMSSPSWTTVAAPVRNTRRAWRRSAREPEPLKRASSARATSQPGNFRCPHLRSFQRPVTRSSVIEALRSAVACHALRSLHMEYQSGRFSHRDIQRMPTLKLHYDGWLALPASLRQKLGLNSGDRVEAELVDGGLTLRPVARTTNPAPARAPAAPPAVSAATTLPLAPDTAPARRKPGRPRKVAAVVGENAAAPKKMRGRPRKIALAGEPDTAASPRVVLGPPKLLKKADLEARTTPPNTPAPAIRPATRIRPDRGSQPVERRPFRNVEIRPLGPGLGRSKRFGWDRASNQLVDKMIWVITISKNSQILSLKPASMRWVRPVLWRDSGSAEDGDADVV
jgi:hypothetical protein